MEKLDVFNCANILIASYFTDDRVCEHENKEHTLIYLCSGELNIRQENNTTTLKPGQCAFLRRDNRMWLHKQASANNPYHSIVLKFSRPFLRNFYHSLPSDSLPQNIKRNKKALYLFPPSQTDVVKLFESIQPYFIDPKNEPPTEELEQKMEEGVNILLNTDKDLYATLFDFVETWKIDIIDFIDKNYMYDLSIDEIASYTGRSLATFKRDFAKVSDISPRKWLIRRRLQAAHELINAGGKNVTDICYEVGFKNLSHFSKCYRQMYGCPPSRHI